jgi:hypothetical protein
MRWRAATFVGILLLYMVGPNVEFHGARAADLIVLLFVPTYVATTRLKIHWTIAVLFLTPAFIVGASAAGKFFQGTGVGSDEFRNILRMCNLGLLAALGTSLVRTEYERDPSRCTRTLVRVVVAGIVFVSVAGLIQYVKPGLFTRTLGALYVIELRNNSSNIEQAAKYARVTSIFSWANALAGFLLYSLTTVMLNAASLRKREYSLALGLGIPVLLLTNARMSLLLVACLLLYVGVVQHRWTALTMIGLVSALVLTFVPLEHLIGASNVERFEELFALVAHGTLPINVAVRLETLSTLPAKIMASPYVLFGFPMAVYQSTIFISWDNQYLGFFVKYGLLGALLVLWQIAIVIVAFGLVRRERSGELRLLLHAVFLVNLFMLIGGISEDTLLTERWREFHFVFDAIVLSLALTRRRPQGRVAPRPEHGVLDAAT